MTNHLRILLCLLFIKSTVVAQSLPRQNGDTSIIPGSCDLNAYVKGINAKTDRLDQKLDKLTAKALRKFQKKEAGIQRKLARTDSLKALAFFGNAQEQYNQLDQRLQNTNSIQQYIPVFDTISVSIKFLEQNPQLASTADGSDKLKATITKVTGLGSKFEKAEEIKKFLRERKQYLKDRLQHLGFAKQVKKLNKQAYYYSEQLNEYKALLKDHKKTERKVIELLSKTKLFQNFMRKNSMLASLFRLPCDPGDPINTASLAGLQTRAQVNGLIQQIVGSSLNAQQQFQQNIQGAQSQLNELKNKISQLGAASSDAEMPEGFKPNNQKTKSFLKRLELGTNFQSQKANGFFPTTSDIGLSLGYKLTDKSIIGVGVSYKMGWGKNIRHINITHQGAALRSFVDWKIKGSFWLSGGYEMNYRSEFRNVDDLKNLNAWQQSGLIGLSKVVSLKTNFFKKTKLQLLWDFLSYQQVPRTPIIFRVGYSF